MDKDVFGIQEFGSGSLKYRATNGHDAIMLSKVGRIRLARGIDRPSLQLLLVHGEMSWSRSIYLVLHEEVEGGVVEYVLHDIRDDGTIFSQFESTQEIEQWLILFGYTKNVSLKHWLDELCRPFLDGNIIDYSIVT